MTDIGRSSTTNGAVQNGSQSVLSAVSFPATFELYFDSIEKDAASVFPRKQQRRARSDAATQIDGFLNTASKVLAKARELQARHGDAEQIYVFLYRYALLIGQWLPRTFPVEWNSYGVVSADDADATKKAEKKATAQTLCSGVITELEQLKPQLRQLYEQRKQRLLAGAVGDILFTPSGSTAVTISGSGSASNSGSSSLVDPVLQFSREFKHISLLMQLDPARSACTEVSCSHDRSTTESAQSEAESASAMLYPISRAIRTAQLQYQPSFRPALPSSASSSSVAVQIGNDTTTPAQIDTAASPPASFSAGPDDEHSSSATATTTATPAVETNLSVSTDSTPIPTSSSSVSNASITSTPPAIASASAPPVVDVSGSAPTVSIPVASAAAAAPAATSSSPAASVAENTSAVKPEASPAAVQRLASPAPAAAAAFPPAYRARPPPNALETQSSRPKTAPAAARPPASASVSYPVLTTPTNPAVIPLRRVVIYATMFTRFMAHAEANTAIHKETCGILAGVEGNDGRLYVNTLIIPKQVGSTDTVTTTHEEELLQYQEQRSLLTFGWVHTHPTHDLFMSSVDLHTHFCYQCQLREAIAIVIAPLRSPNFGIFRLTEPEGISSIQNCRQKGFHMHSGRDSLYKVCDHVDLVWGEEHANKFTVVDQRFPS